MLGLYIHNAVEQLDNPEVLDIFGYGGVRAMFLGFKLHLKAISLGLKFAT